MKISSYLKRETISLDITSTTKDGAIREVFESLRGSPGIQDGDRLLDEIFTREEEASTAIGRCVAIPHARTNTAADFTLALGISKKGIDFGAPDGKPVHLILVMAIPVARVSDYLKALAHLSHLFKKIGFIDKILKAPTPEDVFGIFNENENQSFVDK